MKSNQALIVIDIQPVFLREPKMLTLDGDHLVPRCKDLIARARSAGTPVIYVQHVDVEDMPEGTPATEIAFHPDLAPQSGEPVIEKRFGSGFMQTNLRETLDQAKIQRLMICGLSAYGCVNQTVLFAKLYGYDVTVIQDAVAAPDVEAFRTSEGIPIHLKAWEQGGVRLVSSSHAEF
jgi:nicotinamidase-related amidase